MLEFITNNIVLVIVLVSIYSIISAIYNTSILILCQDHHLDKIEYKINIFGNLSLPGKFLYALSAINVITISGYILYLVFAILFNAIMFAIKITVKGDS